MNILLTSAGRRGYLVNYFKEALAGSGKVIAANSADCPAFRVADEAVITPLIYSDEYIPCLLELCRRERVGLLLPLFDVDVPVLAKNKDAFNAVGTTAVVPSVEVANACNDKLRTASALATKHLPFPKTAATLDEALAKLSRGEFSFPLVVKPRWGMGSIGLHVVHDEDELRAACLLVRGEISRSYLRFESEEGIGCPFIVQEMVRGDEYGLDVICDLDSHFRSVSIKKKAAMRAGETDEAMVVDNPELVRLGERIAAAFPHPGNMDVDVIVGKDGPVVLEMNARFGGGYPFTHIAGVDLPAAIVAWASGGDVSDEALRPAAGTRAYKDILISKIG